MTYETFHILAHTW